jgi:hypothetical protein
MSPIKFVIALLFSFQILHFCPSTSVDSICSQPRQKSLILSPSSDKHKAESMLIEKGSLPQQLTPIWTRSMNLILNSSVWDLCLLFRVVLVVLHGLGEVCVFNIFTFDLILRAVKACSRETHISETSVRLRKCPPSLNVHVDLFKPARPKKYLILSRAQEIFTRVALEPVRQVPPQT